MPETFCSTLESFRAAGVPAEDLSKCAPEVSDAYLPADFPDGRAPAGRVYPGFLVIEDWQRAPIKGNRWYLQVGNCEWLSNDLAELEEHLYSYYVSESPLAPANSGAAG